MAYFRMRRQLDLPIAPAPLPDGVGLVPFTRERARQGRELMQSVYPDGLNDGGISFDGFWTWLTSDEEFDPELIFVAESGGTVVGLCHCWRGNFIKDLVVAPEYRNRGLGTALLTRALEAFAQRGAASVELKTDVDNDTAQSLYRTLGFEVVEQVGIEDLPPDPDPPAG